MRLEAPSDVPAQLHSRRQARRIRRLLRKMDRLDRRRRRRHVGAVRHFRRGMVAAAAGGALLTLVPVLPKEPLGEPPTVAPGQGMYAFTNVQPGNGKPVGYDPCEPIRYVVADDLAPAGAEGLVDEAIAEVSAATGLVFEYVGAVGESSPVKQSRPTPWTSDAPPVQIAWSTPEEEPALAGGVLGVGGSVGYGLPGGSDWRLTTGSVHLDGPELGAFLVDADGEARVRATIMHELAHVVGLDHVDDPSELMYEESWFQTTWGPGDREGLAALGSVRCFGLRPVVDVGWSLPLNLI